MDLAFAETPGQGPSRRNSPASPCASSAPAPSASSPASARSTRATSTPSTWSTPPTSRIASSGSATAGSRRTCRRRSRSITTRHYYDPDGLDVTTRILVSPIAYNTNLVKKEEAPKSFADLLDPKWKGKMVKAHPAYSGTIMNATFQIARDLGWELSGEARQAERPAGAVGDRHAEEDRARRARHHGRRRRLSRHPQQGGRPAGRDRLSDGGHAARHRPERGVQGRAQSERRAPVPELDARARGASRFWSIGRGSIRRTSRPWKSPASGSSPTSS